MLLVYHFSYINQILVLFLFLFGRFWWGNKSQFLTKIKKSFDKNKFFNIYKIIFTQKNKYEQFNPKYLLLLFLSKDLKDVFWY